MIVRLSHPWRWHHTLDVLDTELGDLTEPEARMLTRAGFARDVDDLITPIGGGWLTVPTATGDLIRVRGRAAALAALREEAGQ